MLGTWQGLVMLPMGGNYSDSSLSHVMSQLTATGRNDSPASGSFREANLQRRLSGGEFEELSVATRPTRDVQVFSANDSKAVVAVLAWHEVARL